MKDKMVYCLSIIIGVILIAWGCVILAANPLRSKNNIELKDDIIMASTKTMNITELSNYAEIYVKGR